MLKRLAYICFCLLLLYLIPASWTGQVRTLAANLLRPVATVLIDQNVKIRNFFLSIDQIPSLRQDNTNLEAQVVNLQQQLLDKDRLTRENQALRQELGVTGVTVPVKKVLGHVIIEGSDPEDRTITVDVGSTSGVKIGQPAVYQGALIGRVVTVRESTAVIRTVYSRDSRLQAWLSDSHEKGLLQGDGSQVLLTDVTQGATIAPQTTVETSGLGGDLPSGILIGQISSLLSQPNDPSQEFLITLAQDPLAISTLFILLVNSQ
ncbi:rod shape-determining protein MreC [Patescibacteria group bacterium]|nr:rod shape-determining protein MreC [Patescibacteria group bacterium]